MSKKRRNRDTPCSFFIHLVDVFVPLVSGILKIFSSDKKVYAYLKIVSYGKNGVGGRPYFFSFISAYSVRG